MSVHAFTSPNLVISLAGLFTTAEKRMWTYTSTRVIYERPTNGPELITPGIHVEMSNSTLNTI